MRGGRRVPFHASAGGAGVGRGNEKTGGTVGCGPEVRRIDNRALDGGAATAIVCALFSARPRLVSSATEVWGLR